MTRHEMRRSTPRGFYSVVCWQPKHETNVGSLWRSALLYDAHSIGTIGRRYVRQPSDTPNTPNVIPLVAYDDIDDLKSHLPFGCPLIGVEMTDDAIPLNRFYHPPNACYLMGAEDHGLPPHVLAKCHQVVSIPSPKPWSMNVATAGGILMYDRYSKRAR